LDKPSDPISGDWSLQVSMPEMDEPFQLTGTFALNARDNSVTGSLTMMDMPFPITTGKFDPATGTLTFSLSLPDGSVSTTNATVSGDSLQGTATGPEGAANISGTRTSGGGGGGGGRRGEGKGKKDEAEFEMPPETYVTPLGAYGLAEPPMPQNVIITNATIWTSGPQGIINDGWMIVRNGKIASLGTGAAPAAAGSAGGSSADAITIDVAGRHVTPGIIDCHSHTGISGSVNEFSQSNTAEVRIGDVINPDDIDVYRQLAGGTTAANQLHGSANVIGGQNSVVKWKWGMRDEDFKIKDAVPGIKFALGENVKRSQGRYPNTRMGVEAWARDAFTAASEYLQSWDRYNALPADRKAATMPPRRDLELECLGEILQGKRLVHCHSYRQDEILMLIRVADDFGFTIGTFQHVLEGYKVADAIARHGAGGSTFSDWWAYKIEVIDAIPYNGSLMTEAGVVVSFNSDSDELARRLNTEAGKAVRYGGMKPEEALKLVTINPAKQLRIDKRTGSLEAGKDADFVIWSGDPLSAYSVCEQTWVEGVREFDIEADKQVQAEITAERQRLIQKILRQSNGKPETNATATQPDASQPGDASQPATQAAPGDRPHIHLSEAQRAYVLEQLRNGIDPLEVRPGECGCNEDLHGSSLEDSSQ